MKATRLFKIFGIDIKIHYSWWFIFVLLTWSLSSHFFPALCSGELADLSISCGDISQYTYWIMGVSAALLLFLSVLLHELSHSLVAMAKKIKVESITLFFFGGVAGITEEDMKPSSEFQMAIAGPLFSLFLSGVFFLIFKFNGNGIITAITFYLYQLNFILALFNLVPGFPLDGGRAFRAILYAYYKDLKKATRIAVGVGKFFAMFLMITGGIGLFTGIGGGLWFILIGGFLYFIAGMSYEQVVIKEVLAKIPIKELVNTKLSKLNPEMKFSDFIKKYQKSSELLFLVKGKGFSGILNINQVSVLSKKMQDVLKVSSVSMPFNQIKGVNSKSNAYDAFQKVLSQKIEVIPVMSGSKLTGVVTKKNVMNRLLWELRFNEEKSKLVKRISKRSFHK
jgi:Zn-dependent protease/predicted transcriptional regulator